MKNKSSLLLLVLGIFLFSVISVSAVTLITPANSATISGTAILNATNTTLPAMVNCTFYAKSASTANSSWTSLGTFTNATANALSINGTFDSATFEDSNDYQFNATCRNSTNTMQDVVSTASIKIDNTVPQALSSILPATNTYDEDGSVTFSATVVGVNTTGCTLYFSGVSPGSSSYAMTHSGNTCTKTLSSISDYGYNWYIIGTDGTNTTTTSTYTINVDTSSGGFPGQVIQVNPKTGKPLAVTGADNNIGGIPIWGIVLAVIAIIILVIYLRKR